MTDREMRLNVFGSALSAAEVDAVTGSIQMNWVGMGREVTRFE